MEYARREYIAGAEVCIPVSSSREFNPSVGRDQSLILAQLYVLGHFVMRTVILHAILYRIDALMK